MGRRILLIAYNYPPLISPQSLRWFYLTRELVKKGHSVDVVTIRMPVRFRDMVDEIPGALRTHRTFPGLFYYVTHRYSREPTEVRPAGVSARPSFLWSTLTRTHLAVHKVLNAVLFPDIYAEWFPFALRVALRLVSEDRYDVVISSSEPRVCHLIGSVIKKQANIPWIADYGDPWNYPVPTWREPKWKKHLLERLESRLLRKMDHVTVAAEGIKRLYHERYPCLADECVSVMPQGFDPGIFSNVTGEVSSKFRIVYCGSLYRGLRDPTAFFDAVSELSDSDIEIVVAGRINEFVEVIQSGRLSGTVRYRGFLGHKETLSLEKGASVLLHIGNATDVQVPGKIYEYLGTRRPILCIKGGVGDPSAELVLRYNRGLVVDHDSDAIGKGLTDLFLSWKLGELDNRFSLEAIHDFTWERSAGILCKVIAGL